jgi:hypothetical protein
LTLLSVPVLPEPKEIPKRVPCVTINNQNKERNISYGDDDNDSNENNESRLHTRLRWHGGG